MVSLKTKTKRDRVVLASLFFLMHQRIKRRKTKRRWWCRPYVADHGARGNFKHLLQRSRIDDPDTFKEFVRLTPDLFDQVLELIEPQIKKQDTHLRAAVPPDERLAVTLRFLATGKLSDAP